MIGRAALGLAVSLAGCGGPGHDPAAPGLPDEMAPVAGAPELAAPEPEVPRRREGEIVRADLDRVLDAGPGRFLASVEVRAHVVNDSFRGWEVQRSPWREVDLVPGDVVLEVNGRSLQHPLELKALWEDLRRASTISAEVDRRGERFTLRFAVVPGPNPT